MGKWKYLVIHCTATPEGKYYDQEDIKRWHLSPKPKGRGWSKVGYSELFLLDGTIETLVDYNHNDEIESFEMTNGAKGINSVSRHICYVGGTDSKGKAKDTRTEEQKKALEMYVKSFLTVAPYIKIAGHYHFANKACPSFNVEEWLRSIGVKEKNIYKGS